MAEEIPMDTQPTPDDVVAIPEENELEVRPDFD